MPHEKMPDTKMLGRMMSMPLTIQSLIDHAARYHHETEIFSVETDGARTRTNWRNVAARARRLNDALRRHGLAKGDRCATIAWNNARHLECYFGISGAGMICHTLNPRLFPEQLAYIINHARDRIIFCDRTFLPVIAGLRDKLPGVEAFVLLSGADEEMTQTLPGLIFYEDFIASGAADAPWAEVAEGDGSSLCYTSGTTGNPKGVLYTHRSTVLHSLIAATPDVLNLSARDRVLPVVPMFHVNAWGVPYSAALAGASLVLPGPFLDGPSLARLIETEAVNVALGVPTIWQGLLRALEATGAGTTPLKRTVVGGAPCPPALIAAFRDKYGVEVVHAWGMTETSPLGTVNSLLRRHGDLLETEQARLRQSQGRPPYGVELEIVDDHGHPLPEDGNAQGNLRVRGHWVVADYFRAGPGETLAGDGWFDTGDIASISADGFMTIRDRAKDIIKSGGEWISTVELEGIALGHPDIDDAAAIAARHPKWDERPVLLVVPRPGATLTEAAVLAYFTDKVAKWQLPDKVIFVSALPRNNSGKLIKTALRQEYGDVLLRGPAQA